MTFNYSSLKDKGKIFEHKLLKANLELKLIAFFSSEIRKIGILFRKLDFPVQTLDN
jgi:hypothetical protein